jgi:hypothetical protein
MIWTVKSKTESDILLQLHEESDRAAAIIAATVWKIVLPSPFKA